MITEEKSSIPHILLYFKDDLLNKKDKKSLSSICLLDLEKQKQKKLWQSLWRIIATNTGFTVKVLRQTENNFNCWTVSKRLHINKLLIQIIRYRNNISTYTDFALSLKFWRHWLHLFNRGSFIYDIHVKEGWRLKKMAKIADQWRSWDGVGCLVGYELTYMDVHTQKKTIYTCMDMT